MRHSRLQHGGGVAGIISRSGGPDIQKESDAGAGTWVGYMNARMDQRWQAPCRYVIHAVDRSGVW